MVILRDNQAVPDEPGIIAVETKAGKLPAISAETHLMKKYTNPGLHTVQALQAFGRHRKTGYLYSINEMDDDWARNEQHE